MSSIVKRIMEHSHGDNIAIVSGSSETTYGELKGLTRRLSAGLGAYIDSDDETCLVVSHSQLEESLALTLAGWSLGLRVAVLPPYLKRSEVERTLLSCGPVLTVSDSPAAETDVPFFDLLASTKTPPEDADEHAQLVTFTSGTTGTPKCVERPLSRLSDDVESLAAEIDLKPSDRVTAITTALSTTSVLPALVAGAQVVKVPLESPRSFWSHVGKLGITILSGTPYAYEFATRRQPDWKDVEKLRLALNTSARLRPSTSMRFMAQAGVPMRNILCSSEAGHVTFNNSDDEARLAKSVGKPLPAVEVEIRSGTGSLVPDGNEGLICVRSPRTASCYRNDAVASAQVFRDGWVVSSDVGCRDSAGYIMLTGREDDRIHFGAAILDPQEVEDVLLLHPGIEDALVLGEPHERLGQIPIAKIVGDPAKATKESVMAHCKSELSSSRCPQRIEFVTSVDRDFKGQPVRPRSFRFSDC